MKFSGKKYLLCIQRFLITVLLVFLFGEISAQQVLLTRNVLADTIKPHWGQNMRHFAHPYIGLGIMAGSSTTQGGKILYGVSPNLEVGVRYKLKIARHYALGCNLSYNLYSYKLKQNTLKTLPDTVIHKAERLLFSNLTLGIFYRINLGRTGNYIGKFVDLGMYGDWVHYADHYTRDKLTDGTTARLHVSGLNYINDLQYGFFGHFGISRFVFTVKYRMANLFPDNRNYPELPRWTFGMQLGLHKIN